MAFLISPAACVGLVAAAAVAAPSPLDSAALKWESGVLGLSLTGKARSQLLQSSLGGDSTARGEPTRENAAFSQADFELIARPSANTHGSLKFRLHQDWQNHYQEGPTPLVPRWFDYSGQVIDDHVGFAIGDFGARRTPLTIHAAEPDFLFEPEIFAERRQRAMDEWFLGGNRLPLQGLQATGRFDVLPSLLSLQAGASAARLRTANGGDLYWFFWTDEVEKLMGHTFLEARFLDMFTVGVEPIRIVDDKSASRARNNSARMAMDPAANLPQPLYQDVSVDAFRGRMDLSRWLGDISLTAEGEYALSNYHAQRDARDSSSSLGLRLEEVQKLEGTALRAGLEAGYRSGGAYRIGLDFGYLRNDKDFVNDLAQTPVFRPRRILNALNGVRGFGRGYSTFDALYNSVYSVDPITHMNSAEMHSSEIKNYNGTNNWFRAPFTKTSYSNSVTTKSERDLLMGAGNPDSSTLDPHVQLLFPFGPATPNRDGFQARLTGQALDDRVSASVVFASAKEIEGEAMDSLQTEAATFARMGGGLQVQLGGLLGLENRITLAGSFMRETRQRAAFSSRGVSVAAQDFASDFINAGFYAGVWSRLGLLGGWQQIASNPSVGTAISGNSRTFTEGNLSQSQWAAGLEWKLAAAAYVTLEYGQILFDESVSRTKFSQDIANLALILGF